MTDLAAAAQAVVAALADDADDAADDAAVIRVLTELRVPALGGSPSGAATGLLTLPARNP
jgi:hypothetical protein